MVSGCTVPAIDLKDFPAQLPELVKACEEWGCFRLLKHGDILPESLMSDMKSVVRTLFELPEEIKCQNADVITGSGYVAPSAINPLYEALGL